jgi:hypothetical protein
VTSQEAVEHTELPSCQEAEEKGELPSFQETIEQTELPSCQEAVDPSEVPSCQEAVDPTEVPSCQEAVDPTEVPSCQEAIENSDLLSCQEAVEKGEVPSCQEAVEKGELPSCQEAVEKGQLPSCQEAGQTPTITVATVGQMQDSESKSTKCRLATVKLGPAVTVANGVFGNLVIGNTHTNAHASASSRTAESSADKLLVKSVGGTQSNNDEALNKTNTCKSSSSSQLIPTKQDVGGFFNSVVDATSNGNTPGREAIWLAMVEDFLRYDTKAIHDAERKYFASKVFFSFFVNFLAWLVYF